MSGLEFQPCSVLVLWFFTCYLSYLYPFPFFCLVTCKCFHKSSTYLIIHKASNTEVWPYEEVSGYSWHVHLGSAPVYKGDDYNPQVMGNGPQTDTEPVFNETSKEMDYQLVPITSDQIKQFEGKNKSQCFNENLVSYSAPNIFNKSHQIYIVSL